MRVVSVIPAVLVLSLAGPASAQEWEEYVSRADGFRVNVPGQPKVTDTARFAQEGVM
jgi:hypothetical protein